MPKNTKQRPQPGPIESYEPLDPDPNARSNHRASHAHISNKTYLLSQLYQLKQTHRFLAIFTVTASFVTVENNSCLKTMDPGRLQFQYVRQLRWKVYSIIYNMLRPQFSPPSVRVLPTQTNFQTSKSIKDKSTLYLQAILSLVYALGIICTNETRLN